VCLSAHVGALDDVEDFVFLERVPLSVDRIEPRVGVGAAEAVGDGFWGVERRRSWKRRVGVEVLALEVCAVGDDSGGCRVCPSHRVNCSSREGGGAVEGGGGEGGGNSRRHVKWWVRDGVDRCDHGTSVGRDHQARRVVHVARDGRVGNALTRRGDEDDAGRDPDVPEVLEDRARCG
jgi:hypothetical protein